MFFSVFRSGMGAPIVKEIDGEYHHDARKHVLQWKHPVIDASSKTGSLEFSIGGLPSNFFPVTVTFTSQRSYCHIGVSSRIIRY